MRPLAENYATPEIPLTGSSSYSFPSCPATDGIFRGLKLALTSLPTRTVWAALCIASSVPWENLRWTSSEFGPMVMRTTLLRREDRVLCPSMASGAGCGCQCTRLSTLVAGGTSTDSGSLQEAERPGIVPTQSRFLHLR